MQQSLTLLSASIPTVFIAWFVSAIATRIFTRCHQMPTGQLAQVNRAIATAAPKPPKALAVMPSAPSQPKPLVPAKITPTGTPYQAMSLAQLRKLARKRGIEPTGDARKREAWINALDQ